MSPPALRARIERVHGDVDPRAVAASGGQWWWRDDAWMATTDAQITIEAPGPGDPVGASVAVTDLLAEAERSGDAATSDHPGARLRALGATPFDPQATPRFAIGRLSVVHTADGHTFAFSVTDDGSDPPDPIAALAAVAEREAAPPVVAWPEHFDVAPAVPAAKWLDAVEAARQRIADGEATKVVLAREVLITTERDVPPVALAARLRDAYPTSTIFCLALGDGSHLVGASPELLVSVCDDVVRSHPLAGTTRRSEDPAVDRRLAAELLRSDKDRWEHQITIDRVHDTLLGFCSWLDSEPEPSVVPMGPVQHLGTLVAGQLSDPPPTALELAWRLHPTPAVGGEPRAAALDVIAAVEPGDRGFYAGAVGWADAAGDGEWMVSIRCATVRPSVTHVWAGAGIVADSVPDAELAETQAKLRAVLSALVRP